MPRANRHFIPGQIWHITHRWIEKDWPRGIFPFRDDRWPESLAVGGEAFVKEIREALCGRAIGRSVISDGESSSFGIFNNLITPILSPKGPV